MRNLKVLVRLGLPFALLLGLMVLALGVAFVGVRAGAQQASRLELQDVPLLNAAAAMRVAQFDQAVAIRDFVSLPDVAAQRAARQTLAASEKAYSQAAAQLDRLAGAAGAGERLLALAAQLGKRHATVRAKLGQALELADNAEFQQAQTLVYGELRPLLAANSHDLQQLMDIATGLVGARADAARGQARGSEQQLLAVLLVSLALSAAAITAIARGFARPLRSAVEVAERVAEGDLRLSQASGRRDETGRVLTALASMQVRLNALVRDLRLSAHAVGDASERIAAGNAELAARTEQQASSLEETAASIEELAAVVRQNIDSAGRATSLARTAATLAQEGGEAVGGVTQSMQRIQRSAKQVAEIVGLMDEIAFQTNLLALNAAVEAARAGDQGRGFGVVAQQVRHLAQRSGEAARDIKKLVGAAVAEANDGGRAADRASAAMEKTTQAAQEAAELVAQIARATQEQGQGIEQVNATVAQLDTVTQSNASLVQEVSGLTEGLLEQSRELVAAAGRFRLDETADEPRLAPTMALAVG